MDNTPTIDDLATLTLSEERYPTLTPDVYMDGKINYVIKINGEECVFVNSEEDAVKVINSIAITEVARLTKSNPSSKVFRQDPIGDGKQINIYTQSIGMLMNGGLVKEEVITMTPVARAKLSRY